MIFNLDLSNIIEPFYINLKKKNHPKFITNSILVPHTLDKIAFNVANDAYSYIYWPSIKLIVLLCANHSNKPYIILPDFKYINTKVGTDDSHLIKISNRIINAITHKIGTFITINNAEFDLEVSWKIHMYFILNYMDYKLDDVEIVPIIIGNVNIEHLKKLAKSLSNLFSPSTLFIISSELTHYGSFFNYPDKSLRIFLNKSNRWKEWIQDNDKLYINLIKDNNWEKYININGTCGKYSILTWMFIRAIKNDITLNGNLINIDYDYNEIDKEAVGYGSMIFADKNSKMINSLYNFDGRKDKIDYWLKLLKSESESESSNKKLINIYEYTQNIFEFPILIWLIANKYNLLNNFEILRNLIKRDNLPNYLIRIPTNFGIFIKFDNNTNGLLYEDAINCKKSLLDYIIYYTLSLNNCINKIKNHKFITILTKPSKKILSDSYLKSKLQPPSQSHSQSHSQYGITLKHYIQPSIFTQNNSTITTATLLLELDDNYDNPKLEKKIFSSLMMKLGYNKKYWRNWKNEKLGFNAFIYKVYYFDESDTLPQIFF